VVAVLNAWTGIGGHLEYGVEKETSCFLLSRGKSDPGGNIWPATGYPSGKFEVVFQYLHSRQPFNEPPRREELRQRFNKIDGVDLPATKLDQRPGFDLELVVDSTSQERLVEVLEWFHGLARSDIQMDSDDSAGH
jgi:hypothetical protein